MKKIKILRIIARLNIGGPAIHTVLLTEGLDKERFFSVLVCGKLNPGEGDMSYYAAKKKIFPLFIPELRRELNFFNDFLALRKFYSVIKAEKPEIIHTHTAKAGVIGRTAAIAYNFSHLFNKERIKLVHTFHGHVFEGYFSRLRSRIFIFIERFFALFTCEIITLSASLKEELVRLGIAGENKIQVIPLGLELDDFLRIPVEDSVALNIGIVGRLVPIKNHRLFLDAADMIIRENPQTKLKFKVIGDGQLREWIEGYCAKLKLNNHIDFLGWKKELVEVYSLLDIVALTSINEGTPVSLIEAMASAKAVVATDVGGVRDLFGKEADTGIEITGNFKVLERGVIVESNDPESFAKALLFIIKENTLRRDMAIRAREFARDKFAKERLIKDTQALYERILEIP